MTIKLTFKRDATGAPKFTDDELRVLHVQLQKERGTGARVPRELRTFAVERLQSEVRKLQAANSALTYLQAYKFAAEAHKALAYFDRLDIVDDGDDVEIEEAE